MKQNKLLKALRMICLILAIGFTLVPMLVAITSGQGFSEAASHIYMTISLLLAMVWLVLGIKKGDQATTSSALFGCIILGYLLLKMWL